MTNGPAIVIEGTFEEWPGGAQTLTPAYPRPPRENPFRGAHWFAAQLDPDGNEVWFRITQQAIHQMQETLPTERGVRLVYALIDWLREHPDHQLEASSGFYVFVSEAGNVTVQPEPDDE